MDKYLAAAAKFLKVKPEQIIQHRLTDDEIIVLVDEGIGGIKKLAIPLAKLGYDEAIAVEEMIETEAKKVDAVRLRGRK